MALSLTSQWTLVSCGLIAHADGVLDGEECDRLLAMVEGETDAEEYASWLATVSDAKSLEQMLQGLAAPPAEDVRDILESAWALAVADGERTSSEADALARIAARLGVEDVQLDFWRDAWTESQHEFADLAAASMIVILAGSAPLSAGDRILAQELVWRLPTTNEHREDLAGALAAPRRPDDVARKLSRIPRRQREWLLRLLAPAVANGSRPDACAERFVQLATEAGLDPDAAREILTQR